LGRLIGHLNRAMCERFNTEDIGHPFSQCVLHLQNGALGVRPVSTEQSAQRCGMSFAP
jgi:small-conductance mechanosensitive channel